MSVRKSGLFLALYYQSVRNSGSCQSGTQDRFSFSLHHLSQSFLSCTLSFRRLLGILTVVFVFSMEVVFQWRSSRGKELLEDEKPELTANTGDQMSFNGGCRLVEGVVWMDLDRSVFLGWDHSMAVYKRWANYFDGTTSHLTWSCMQREAIWFDRFCGVERFSIFMAYSLFLTRTIQVLYNQTCLFFGRSPPIPGHPCNQTKHTLMSSLSDWVRQVLVDSSPVFLSRSSLG